MKNVNKWSLDDVKAIVNRVSELDENYAFVGKMEIAYNGRLSRTLARCLTEITRRGGKVVEARPFKLEFGKTILNVESKEALEQTVLHEVAHAIANYEHQEKCGHDWRFKEVCKKIGCYDDGTTAKTYSEEIKKASMDVTYKYTLTCKECGKVYGYSRMNETLRSVKNGHHTCYCPKCKCDEFEFKQLR